jgi:chromosome segregation ATPase
MKKIIVLLIISINVLILAETNIVDLKPSSPAYPHVVRMVENNIMDLDNQNRFNGSNNVPRYDLAIFGSKTLDYLENKYGEKIFEFENRLANFENQNLTSRVENLENSFFNYDEIVSKLNNNYTDLNKKVNDLVKLVTPGNELNKDNVVFQNIVENAQKAAEEAAIDQLENLRKQTLSTVIEFENELQSFQEQVNTLNSKYDKSIEYLNTIIVSREEESREDLRSYVDSKFDNEMDALKTSLRNIANSEIGFLQDDFEDELNNVNQRISEIENNQNQYNNNRINSLESKINDLSDKINYLEDYTVPSSPSSNEENLELNAKYQFLETQLERVKNSIDLLDDQVSFNESYINSFSNREDIINSKMQSLNEKYNNLESEIIFVGKKVDNVLYKVSNMENTELNNEELINLTERIASLERFISNFSDEISQLSVYSKGFENINQRIDSINQDIDKNQAIMEDIENTFENFKAQMNSVSSLTNLNEETLSKIGDLGNMAVRITDNQEKINSLNSTIYQNQNRIDNLTLKVDQINSSLENFNVNSDEISNLKTDIESLFDEYYSIKNEMQDDINKQEFKNEIKNEIRSEVSNELITRDRRINNLEVQLDQLKQDDENITNTSDINYTDSGLSINNAKKIEELNQKIEELEKPEQFRLWSNITTGLVGVGVGAFITWFILSSGI